MFFAVGVVNARPLEVISSDGFQTIEVDGEKASGLNVVYIVYQSAPVTLIYSAASSTSRPVWYRFSTLGGGYAEEIKGVDYSGAESTVSDASTDMGYIIEEGDSRYYFWVVGYQTHTFDPQEIMLSDDSDCSRTILHVSGKGEEIYYYGINGRRFTLERGIELSYNNLQWNDERATFEQIEEIKSLNGIENSIIISPPVYCQTSFTLSGDKFLRVWNMEKSLTSAMYRPVAVDCRTTASQTESDEDHSNQINSGSTDGLGGSAPVEIRFEASVTDAVIHTEWQMSRDSDFGNINYRIGGQDLTFTFREEGTTYVRFVGSNSDGSCDTYGDTYTVNIGASELKCPNAFSPGASEGTNDEWKVSYRSLVEFECWIFDRYGTQMYHFSDPSGGWDGRYKGKLVNPGVYYYVINAKGADGKKYKRSGDINILRFKSLRGVSSGE